MVAVEQSRATGERADRRAQLIAVARELFTARPYDEVTTTEIAQRAGVAYGLIAHHFTNKRGLYLASVSSVAECLRAVHDAPPVGDTPAEMLREQIVRHIAFVEENPEGYLALMHGGSGSDPQVRAIIEDFRWSAVTQLMRALGVREPFRPILRTAMSGWVGYFTDSLIDHLQRSDIKRDELATLVIQMLVGTLRTACAIDPDTGIAAELVDQLAP